MQMIKGMEIEFFDKNNIEIVENVLVGEPSMNEGIYGKAPTYTIAVPKGDTHTWNDKKVRFFGDFFRAVGFATQGIDENIPLNWNKKVTVEKIMSNGNCTFFDIITLEKHVFFDIFFCDGRGEITTKDGFQPADCVSIYIYAVNNDNADYSPKTGDFFVLGETDFVFDTSSEKSKSESLKAFRKQFPNYAVVKSVTPKFCGNLPDFEITAR